MADAVISVLLTQITTLLLQKGNQMGGLKLEVQKLKYELGHMRAFLQVAEAKSEDNPRIQEWMKQVREIAYDVENVLDEFKLRFAVHDANAFCGSFRTAFSKIKNLSAHHTMATEIHYINHRIQAISEGQQRYKIEDIATTNQGTGSVPTNTWWDGLLEGIPKLVGIQEPKQQLVSLLLDGDEVLKVLSVVGVQGIGKTTLVKMVHEDGEIRNQFPIRAWVTASQNPNTVELLKHLIQQIYEQIKKPVSKIVESLSSVDRLKSVVRGLLKDKRYAIFFDDVSDMDFWNSIKSAFPEGSYGSRVMLTTRKPDVTQASGLGSEKYVHKMKPLSDNDSWNLFCDRTFKENNCPNHLEPIAQDILSKCEGLPLSIVTMGGLMALKEHKIEEWEMVRTSLNGEEDGIGKLDMVKKIVNLSYQNLPPHLKNCLLYISIFPQDYEIQCRRLIQLWIAEGFVEGRPDMTYEEVASEYLKELIRRNLIELVELSWDGSPFRCRAHNLVREMILSKSREQNMVSIVPRQHQREIEKVYRLVIDHSMRSTQERSNLDHLRSLITFGNVEFLKKEDLDELLSSNLLKVLDLTDAKLEKIPTRVFSLKHLTYLCLRGTGVKTVPNSIGKLQSLEHLHLGETDVTELPKEILKLQKLRHLRVFQVVYSSDKRHQCHGFKPPSAIGELLSLHTLLFIDAQNEKKTIVGEIGKLIYLRELGITKLKREDGKELCSSLEKLTDLQELDIAAILKDEVIDLNFPVSASSFESLLGLTLRGKLERVPRWITQLRSLMKIELTWSKLTVDDPLVYLQDLPNLVQIYFTQAYEGEGLQFKAGGFKKLEMLTLREMNGLKEVRIEKGSMPNLQRLYFSQLPSLEELPWGIKELEKVRSFHLGIMMNSALIERLMKRDEKSEDYLKIGHIPEVIVAFQMNGEWKDCQL